MKVSVFTCGFLGVAASIYVYITWCLSYWERRGLETYTSKKKRSMYNQAYAKFKSKGLKHGGIYLMLKPFYIPVDLDIIQCILQKNFNHFINHEAYVNEKRDPLNATLFNLSDEKWRILRNKLTPTFNSNKMKMLFQMMQDCTPRLIEVIGALSNGSEPIDIKDVMQRFTIDIIGTCAFGIDSNTLRNPDSEFMKHSKRICQHTWRRSNSMLMPKIFTDLLGIKTIDSDVEKYFMDLVKKILDFRESNNIIRKDFMHMLLQLKNRGNVSEDGKIMDNNKRGNFIQFLEIAAQCFNFFVAGFDTTSTLMTFALLELSENQDIQNRLRNEIRKTLKKHGQISYEAVMEMEYLDQVINETLRKQPPAFGVSRVCNKDFEVPNTNFIIKKGVGVMIPVLGIHRDPQLYPDPDKFDPERFSFQNKNRRHPMAFIPFGEGPRMCIGARFGILQAKIGLVAIIDNFRVTLNERTQIPIEYDFRKVFLSVEGDVWLNFTSSE